jgi:hypothetical protein
MGMRADADDGHPAAVGGHRILQVVVIVMWVTSVPGALFVGRPAIFLLSGLVFFGFFASLHLGKSAALGGLSRATLGFTASCSPSGRTIPIKR